MPRPYGAWNKTGTYSNGSQLFCKRGHPVIGDNAYLRLQKSKGGVLRRSYNCKVCLRMNWRHYHAQGSAAISRMLNKERDSRPQITAMDIAQRRAR